MHAVSVFDCLHCSICYYIVLYYSDEEEFIETRRHFTRAEVDGCIYSLNDDAHVKVSDLLFVLLFAKFV